MSLNLFGVIAQRRCQVGVVGPNTGCAGVLTELQNCYVVEPFRKGGPQRVTVPYTKRMQSLICAPE